MSIKLLNPNEAKQIFDLFEKQRIHKREKERQYGKIKSIIHTTHSDMKFVAVGNAIYRSKADQTFPDFLFDFVLITFGKEWCDNEKCKVYNDQHEVFRWYSKSVEFLNKQRPYKGETFRVNPNGITSAFLLFSYDLFTVLNNNIKIEYLIKRLKDKLQFQGARYELFCLAACIRAGFEIELDNEKDSSKKHVEFYIYDKSSNLKIAVEAKSKHRSGVLGRPGERIPEDKIKVGKLTQLINNALSKSEKDPLIVFLDFNLPHEYADYVMGGKSFKKIKQIFDGINKTDDDKDIFNLVVLTNHPYHYGRDDEPKQEKIHSLMYSLNPKHAINNKDLFNNLVYATLQFGAIPNNFDDI